MDDYSLGLMLVLFVGFWVLVFSSWRIASFQLTISRYRKMAADQRDWTANWELTGYVIEEVKRRHLTYEQAVALRRELQRDQKSQNRQHRRNPSALGT